MRLQKTRSLGRFAPAHDLLSHAAQDDQGLPKTLVQLGRLAAVQAQPEYYRLPVALQAQPASAATRQAGAVEVVPFVAPAQAGQQNGSYRVHRLGLRQSAQPVGQAPC